MDVVEASHLEVIKQHLLNNTDHEFKMRKFNGTWILGVYNIYDDFNHIHIASESSFAEAVKKMSNLLSSQYNKEQENGGCRRS